MRNCLPSTCALRACQKHAQLPLFGAANPALCIHTCGDDPGVATTEDVTDCLRNGAPVAIGVSGGKDSSAVAIRTTDYLDQIGHAGPRVLIHSDLGRVEWKQSLPVCERLAQRLRVDLVVVRRQKGDLLDRFRQRWQDNVRRYAELACVKLILPWPTAAMRYCTGELKTAVICRELVQRFPDSTILSVSGIRREESSSRAKAPIAAVQAKLTAARRQTSGFDWRPILHWTKAEVFRYLLRNDFDLHDAYTRYHSSRVSCAFCILGSQSDLASAAACELNAGIYLELVRLEAESTFAFQSTRWLADIAPQLLPAELRELAADAKRRASLREAAEDRIPQALLYTKGWPTRIPTVAEAELLAEVRQTVAGAVGIQIGLTNADSIRNRYQELICLAAAAK